MANTALIAKGREVYSETRAEGAPLAENEYLKAESDDGVVRAFVDRRLEMIQKAWKELPPNTEVLPPNTVVGKTQKVWEERQPNTVVGKDNKKHKLNLDLGGMRIDELEKEISHWINGKRSIDPVTDQEKLDFDVLKLILDMFKDIITSPSTDIPVTIPGAMRWTERIRLWREKVEE